MLKIVAVILVFAVCIQTAFLQSLQAKEVAKQKSTGRKFAPGKSKHSGRGSLVPPPPPVVPLSSEIALPGYVPLGLITGQELEKKKSEITGRLEHLVLILNETIEDSKEKQEKSELFESLYTEGVVSKRELKAAKRDARRIAGDLKESQREVDDARQYLDAINRRLAETTQKVGQPAGIKTGQK